MIAIIQQANMYQIFRPRTTVDLIQCTLKASTQRRLLFQKTTTRVDIVYLEDLEQLVKNLVED